MRKTVIWEILIYLVIRAFQCYNRVWLLHSSDVGQVRDQPVNVISDVVNADWLLERSIQEEAWHVFLLNIKQRRWHVYTERTIANKGSRLPGLRIVSDRRRKKSATYKKIRLSMVGQMCVTSKRIICTAVPCHADLSNPVFFGLGFGDQGVVT